MLKLVTNDTPDLPAVLTESSAYRLYDRESFRVGERTFKRTEPGEYTDGKVIVFCDQQDSTAWGARCHGAWTGYYWTPERAVQSLLEVARCL
jgi:hypothetical protein